MGQLVDGEWRTGWYEPDPEGRFRRPDTKFHDRVTADGSSGFPAQAGRYHLYVSYACPWAHRTLVTRAVRRLEPVVGVSIVDPHMGSDGWEFSDAPGTVPDTVNGARLLREIYLKSQPRYTGRVTVPVLWDRESQTIVNNTSREIMRMLDVEFRAFGDPERTLLPEGLAPAVDAGLDAIYEPINNGVYKAGFATSQAAYADACSTLFDALDRWEGVLGEQRYLCGDRLTEADVAMYTTLVRFDLVYYAHFKCNLRRLRDHHNLWNYLLDLHQTPGFRETTHLDHIKTHYYWSQTTVNPHRIVPLGPTLDYDAPHDRGG
jgi:glutathionyl-hydroquinone reductase